MIAHSVVNALFGSYDLRSSKQWRDEDMAHREQEIQWLNDEFVRAHEWRNADIERSLRREKMEHEHLVCEARAEQLHTVSEQCALLGGFTVIAMSNLGIPEGIHHALLVSYAVSATLVCVLLILATIMCTMLLVAVTRYAAHSLEDEVKALDVVRLEVVSPFGRWWLRSCEREQMRAYKFMGVGVVLFFVYLALLSWIQFYKSTWTSSSISVMCLVATLTWQLRIASRWRYLLLPPTEQFTPSARHQSLLVVPPSPSHGLLLTPLAQRKAFQASTSPAHKLGEPYVSMR